MMIKRLIFVLFAVAGITAVFAAWSALDRPIQTIVVSGEPTKAERRQVEETVASAELAGILSTNLNAMEAQLKQLGWTRSVTVRRHWPDRLVPGCTRVPVARWGDHDYLADGQPLKLPDHYADLPLLKAYQHAPRRWRFIGCCSFLYRVSRCG